LHYSLAISQTLIARTLLVCVIFLASPHLVFSVKAQHLKKDLPLTEIGWLESDVDPVIHLTQEAQTCLRPAKDTQIQSLIDIGEIAFRSPVLFGGLAARKKLSCDSCHQNGAVNDQFFIKSLSDKPGRIDVTAAIFSKTLEDNQFNPIPIPTLYGLNNKKIFGTLSPLSSKRAFVRRVIIDEFDGPEPNPRIFEALMTYVDHLSDSCVSEKTSRSALKDFDRINRAITIAIEEWERGNENVADFILLSTRHELGFINERYHGKFLKNQRQKLEKFSRKIQILRDEIAVSKAKGHEHEFQRIQFETLTSDWKKAAKKLNKSLARKEKKSLYKENILRAELEN